MKSAIHILFLFLLFQSQAQSWQSIPASYFGVLNVYGNTGYYSHSFSINPYDNSLWLIRNTTITHLKNDGTFESYDPSNTPVFSGVYKFRDFAFLDQRVLMTEVSTGLYDFDGTNWNHTYFLEGPTHIAVEADSIWLGRGNNGSAYKIVNGSPVALSSNIDLTRIISRNGYAWISTQPIGGAGIGRYYEQTGNSVGFLPTSSNLLSVTNNDFKFSPHNDSMYVAGDLGLSIAYQNAFIDSITVNNTSNMPSSEILEFEFDSQDNIWALFGSALNSPESIAYLDRTTNTWTSVYDSNNSPISFNLQVSIEIDTADNLWVAERDNIHVLKVNNWPTWLEQNELSFNQQKELIGVYDVLGRETEEKPNTVLIYVYSDGTSKKVFRFE